MTLEIRLLRFYDITMLHSDFSDYFAFFCHKLSFVCFSCFVLELLKFQQRLFFAWVVNCRLLSDMFTLINPVSFPSFIFFQTHCFQLFANVPGGHRGPSFPVVPCDPLGPGSPSLLGFPASPLSPRGPVDPCGPGEPAMPAGPEGPGFPGIPGIPGAQKQAP